MSVTDLPVRVVDDFVPTETAYIVIRYNRNATPIKKGCTGQMRVFKFIPTKTFNRLKCHTNQK